MNFKRLLLTSALALSLPAAAHGRSDRFVMNLGFLPWLAFGMAVEQHVQPVYYPPPPPPQPQVVYVQTPPPPPQYVYVPTAPPPPPTVAYLPPAAAVTTPPPPAPRREEPPAHLALKWLGGPTSVVTFGGAPTLGVPTMGHSLGAEWRLADWAALRTDLDFRAAGTSWDVLGFKLSAPSPVLSPYASVSLSGTSTALQPDRLQVGLMGALGLDLKLGRNFFLEGEVRYRVAPDSCCRDVPQVTGLVGGGVAFL